MGRYVSPAAYSVPCVRFTCFVRSAVVRNSATGATLGTGCWLGFARLGLPSFEGHPTRSTKLRLAHQRRCSQAARYERSFEKQHVRPHPCRNLSGSGPLDRSLRANRSLCSGVVAPERMLMRQGRRNGCLIYNSSDGPPSTRSR